MFQIKNFSSIVASLINYVKGTTSAVSDFNVGSVARTMLEAPAVEMEELYIQMFNGVKEAIPVALYNSLNFTLLPGVAASNVVRVTVTSSALALIIPAGTVFTASGLSTTYASIADATIAAGATYIDVPVAAQAVGVIGNIPANQSFTVQPSPAGFVSAINATAFINGIDAETEDGRKARFGAYIHSLPRGTLAALTYGLQTAAILDVNGNTTERVASSAIIEPYLADPTQPVGLVNCYIHNGVGSTSAALVALAQQIIAGYYDSNGNAVPGWKSAGTLVNIYAATEQLVAFTCVLTVTAGYDRPTTVALASSAVATYLQNLSIGATALVAEMVAQVMAVDGVSNVVVSAPAADVPAAANAKLMPGTLTFN